MQLDVKSFDMGVLFLPSKIPPKRPIPIVSDPAANPDSDGDASDGTDYDHDEAVAAAMAAAGGGSSSPGAGVAAPPQPFSCDPDGVLFRLKPLSYRCPEQAPNPTLKTLPLGLLPIPHQLPGETCIWIYIYVCIHTYSDSCVMRREGWIYLSSTDGRRRWEYNFLEGHHHHHSNINMYPIQFGLHC